MEGNVLSRLKLLTKYLFPGCHLQFLNFLDDSHPHYSELAQLVIAKKKKKKKNSHCHNNQCPFVLFFFFFFNKHTEVWVKFVLYIRQFDNFVQQKHFYKAWFANIAYTSKNKIENSRQLKNTVPCQRIAQCNNGPPCNLAITRFTSCFRVKK